MKTIFRIILFCFVVASLIFGCVHVGSAQVPTSPTYTGNISDPNVYFPLYSKGKQYKVPGSEVAGNNDTLIAGSGLRRIGDTLKLGADPFGSGEGLLTEDLWLYQTPNTYWALGTHAGTLQTENSLVLQAGSGLTSDWWTQFHMSSTDTTSKISMLRITNTGSQGIELGTLDKMFVSDNVNQIGLEYVAKYRPDNDRWLTDKEYVDSASTSGTLQSVTDNGNVTSNALQVTGDGNLNFDVTSFAIAANSNTHDVEMGITIAGDFTPFLQVDNLNRIALGIPGAGLTLGVENDTLFASFGLPVTGFPAVKDSQFVTLGQMTATLDSLGLNFIIHEKGSANIVGDGSTTSFDVDFTAFPVTTNYMVIITPRSETPSPWFIPSQSNGQFTIQFNTAPPVSPPAAPVVIDYLIVEY